MIREDDASKSRKDRKCIECARVTPAGIPHQLHIGEFEGEINEYRTCSCTGGFVYGQLWEDLEYALDEGVTTGCLDKLQTVEAKRYLRGRWMEHKGLTA